MPSIHELQVLDLALKVLLGFIVVGIVGSLIQQIYLGRKQ